MSAKFEALKTRSCLHSQSALLVDEDLPSEVLRVLSSATPKEVAPAAAENDAAVDSIATSATTSSSSGGSGGGGGDATAESKSLQKVAYGGKKGAGANKQLYVL